MRSRGRRGPRCWLGLGRRHFDAADGIKVPQLDFLREASEHTGIRDDEAESTHPVLIVDPRIDDPDPVGIAPPLHLSPDLYRYSFPAPTGVDAARVARCHHTVQV